MKRDIHDAFAELCNALTPLVWAVDTGEVQDLLDAKTDLPRVQRLVEEVRGYVAAIPMVPAKVTQQDVDDAHAEYERLLEASTTLTRRVGKEEAARTFVDVQRMGRQPRISRRRAG